MSATVATKTVTLTIDGEQVTVPAGTTLMDAADSIGIHIPRLCYHPDLSIEGACRVCIVQLEGVDFFMASCSVEAKDGMVVQTNSPMIREARRDIVELLLDNHPQECQTCERDGNCELQNLAYTLGVRERLFAGERKRYERDEASVSVVRDPEKCILCGRCFRVCSEIQGVYNLSQQGRGFDTVVSPAGGLPMDESTCIQCGQCINVCPTAAFLEKNHTDQVWAALADEDMHVVVQTAPAIRAAVGEGFGLPPGTPCTGKLATALRKLGFDAVFDTNFTADLTIVEEATEFLKRLESGENLPLLTSCSPGWVNFMEKFYPEMIPLASTCKSPMGMMSALIKTYYAEKMGLDPAKIFVVSVMPCVAKKFEMARPEMAEPDGTPYTDAVLTTRELVWMVKSYGIDFKRLPDSEFDAPLGVSTGAADIFGTTGGVMEAALRTAYDLATGKVGTNIEFYDVRAVEGLRECKIDIDGTELSIGVANGLQNAKKLLDWVKSGEKTFHAIEIMACPGGCIGGGGQPYPPDGVKVLDQDLLAKRRSALYTIDEQKTIRKSHENPAIQALYDEWLGEAGGEKSHQYLHTHYQSRLPRGIK